MHHKDTSCKTEISRTKYTLCVCINVKLKIWQNKTLLMDFTMKNNNGISQKMSISISGEEVVVFGKGCGNILESQLRYNVLSVCFMGIHFAIIH